MRVLGSVLVWICAAILTVIGVGLLAYSLIAWDALTVLGYVVAVVCAVVGLSLGVLAWRLGTSRPCPQCGKGVKKGIVVCPTCGFDFSATVPQAGAKA